MKKSLLNLTIMAFLATASSAALAADIGTLITFTSGDPALASEVNDNFADVKTAVNTKADATDVTSNDADILANSDALDLKADTSTVNTALGLKADTSTVNTALGLKADTTTVTANDADITALQQNGNPTGVACTGNDIDDIMVRVGPLCVDKYEASVWTTADGSASGSQFGISSDDYDTGAVGGVTCSDNANDCKGSNTIYARSEVGVNPSTSITWYQAQQACAASGKRLLTNAEWQMAAAGTPDTADDGNDTCVTGGASVQATGSRSLCISNWAVNDMSGNLWEWVADWVQGDTDAWAPAATNAGSDYGTDVMAGANPATSQGTNSSNQISALYRGGKHSAANGGIFALVASAAPSVSVDGLGFRCAR